MPSLSTVVVLVSFLTGAPDTTGAALVRAMHARHHEHFPRILTLLRDIFVRDPSETIAALEASGCKLDVTH